MATQYTLRVINDSRLYGSVCLYQRNPAQSTYQDLCSLAWLSKLSPPGTTLVFRWTTDYSFVWSETGSLAPSVYFDASEVVAADPENKTAKNSIEFTREGGAYHFKSATRPAKGGYLEIMNDGSIPTSGASVGIGMSGQGIFALHATPNFVFTFAPHPEYWIAIGDFVEGRVMDTYAVSNPANIKFADGEYSKSIILNSHNTWSDAKTLKEYNEQILQRFR